MTESMAECAGCRVQRKSRPAKTGLPKLPAGWKRNAGRIFCGQCWRDQYLLRALIFPIAEPLSGTWKELESDLRTMWAQTTSAANWMMTQCYARDIRRTPDLERMPPMKWIYLYPEARVLFPKLPAKSVTSLEQAIRKTYLSMRCDVAWTCAASLPTMRYPHPFPLHNQSWSVHFDEGNRPVLSARIGERRWNLRLRGGSRYRRQVEGLRRITLPGELTIGKWHDGTIWCKLVGWLARNGDRRTGTGALRVRTGEDCLLRAFDEKGNRLWIENCDQMPRWIAEFRKKWQRLAEDWKAEQRPIPKFASYRETLVRKHRNRMKSAIQETAAHLANFAARRRYAEIQYDDSQRWLEEFAYADLEDRIRLDVEERGIRFVKVGGNPAVPSIAGAGTEEQD